jgi:hypothetical protein
LQKRTSMDEHAPFELKECQHCAGMRRMPL